MSVERNRVPCGGSRAEDQAIYRQRVLVVALFNLSAGQRALAPLTPHIGKIADAGGVRVVSVAEHRRRRRSLSYLGVDPGEIDPLVEPMADAFIAGIGTKSGKLPMYL